MSKILDLYIAFLVIFNIILFIVFPVTVFIYLKCNKNNKL